MANTCCVCGSKISSWAKERPISENQPKQFFCDKCFEVTKILQKRPVADVDKFHKATLYIDEYINSGKLEPQVVEVLENIKAGTTDAMIEVEKVLEEKRKYDYILTSNGHNFEGYKITKYIKIVVGETVLGTGFGSEMAAGFADFFGTTSGAFKDKLATAREESMQELYKQTIQCGGNAIIGIGFDYHQFGSNLIGVIISGTAVVIEKIEE
ncbi:MAG: YbjQ family protein [Bacillota bacterium]